MAPPSLKTSLSSGPKHQCSKGTRRVRWIDDCACIDINIPSSSSASTSENNTITSAAAISQMLNDDMNELFFDATNVCLTYVCGDPCNGDESDILNTPDDDKPKTKQRTGAELNSASGHVTNGIIAVGTDSFSADDDDYTDSTAESSVSSKKFILPPNDEEKTMPSATQNEIPSDTSPTPPQTVMSSNFLNHNTSPSKLKRSTSSPKSSSIMRIHVLYQDRSASGDTKYQHMETFDHSAMIQQQQHQQEQQCKSGRSRKLLTDVVLKKAYSFGRTISFSRTISSVTLSKNLDMKKSYTKNSAQMKNENNDTISLHSEPSISTKSNSTADSIVPEVQRHADGTALLSKIIHRRKALKKSSNEEEPQHCKHSVSQSSDSTQKEKVDSNVHKSTLRRLFVK